MVNKKSQITLYIIIGLLVVVGVAYFFASQREKNSNEHFGGEIDASSLKSKMDVVDFAIDVCVEKLYYDAVERYGYGRDNEIVSFIKLNLDACIDWSKLKESYPMIQNHPEGLDLKLTEEEYIYYLTMTYPIDADIDGEKASLSEFSYTFSKLSNGKILLEDGKTVTDFTLRSGDGQLELFVPKGTSVTYEDGKDIGEVEISIDSKKNEEKSSGMVGEFLYELKPDNVRFSPAVELRMKISSNVDRAVYPDINSAFLTSTGIWASVPSYVDPYNDLVVGYTYHFSTRGENTKTNNPYSYGLGWIYHESTNSKLSCDALSQQKAFKTSKLYDWPTCEESDPESIYLDESLGYTYLGEKDCEEAESLADNEFISCQQGFTKEEDLKDIIEDLIVYDDEQKKECGTAPKPVTQPRIGYESKDKVGGESEFSVYIMGIDQETGNRPAIDPNGLVDISILSDGKPTVDKYDTNEAGKVNKVATLFTSSVQQGENLVPGSEFPFKVTTQYMDNELKDSLKTEDIMATGCTKTTAEFIVKGRYLACSIRNRFNYLGGASDSQDGESGALNALIGYFEKEIEKENIFFEGVDDAFKYFNLPLDMINDYKGLPQDIVSQFNYDDNTARQLECCADDQYFNGKDCVKNELPSCVKDETTGELGPVPCDFGGFVIQSAGFTGFNALPNGQLCDINCEDVSIEDYLSGNFENCPSPTNIGEDGCICADTNEIIDTPNGVCVKIPGGLK